MFVQGSQLFRDIVLGLRARIVQRCMFRVPNSSETLCQGLEPESFRNVCLEFLIVQRHCVRAQSQNRSEMFAQVLNCLDTLCLGLEPESFRDVCLGFPIVQRRCVRAQSHNRSEKFTQGSQLFRDIVLGLRARIVQRCLLRVPNCSETLCQGLEPESFRDVCLGFPIVQRHCVRPENRNLSDLFVGFRFVQRCRVRVQYRSEMFLEGL